MASFGDRLKELRTLAVLTQREVAEIAETDTSTVSKWEQGRATPSKILQRSILGDLEMRVARRLGTESPALREIYAPQITPPRGVRSPAAAVCDWSEDVERRLRTVELQLSQLLEWTKQFNREEQR